MGEPGELEVVVAALADKYLRSAVERVVEVIGRHRCKSVYVRARVCGEIYFTQMTGVVVGKTI